MVLAHTRARRVEMSSRSVRRDIFASVSEKKTLEAVVGGNGDGDGGEEEDLGS